VQVGVGVAVAVGVAVGVEVSVAVGVNVSVAVAVGEAFGHSEVATSHPVAEKETRAKASNMTTATALRILVTLRNAINVDCHPPCS